MDAELSLNGWPSNPPASLIPIPHQKLVQAHKLMFIQHSITSYLLPYEAHRIASVSKAFYEHICRSTYCCYHFVRDALYWRRYSNQRYRPGPAVYDDDHLQNQMETHHQSTHSQRSIHFDFTKTLQSLDIQELMQLKYSVIHLHTINQYISSRNNDSGYRRK